MNLSDIRVIDDDGTVLYEGPPFTRCEEYGCRRLMTHGQVAAQGTCICGGRRSRPALILLEEEIEGLKSGAYLLTEWEQKLVNEEFLNG